MKLKVGDTVMVITGSDRGKKGKVERVWPDKNLVGVEKIGHIKKHLKPSTRNPKGGIVEVSRPLLASKVMAVCPHCGKPTRVGLKIAGDKKIRLCKHCGKALDEKSKS